jgi:hypothetical protein
MRKKTKLLVCGLLMIALCLSQPAILVKAGNTNGEFNREISSQTGYWHLKEVKSFSNTCGTTPGMKDKKNQPVTSFPCDITIDQRDYTDNDGDHFIINTHDILVSEYSQKEEGYYYRKSDKSTSELKYTAIKEFGPMPLVVYQDEKFYIPVSVSVSFTNQGKYWIDKINKKQGLDIYNTLKRNFLNKDDGNSVKIVIHDGKSIPDVGKVSDTGSYVCVGPDPTKCNNSFSLEIWLYGHNSSCYQSIATYEWIKGKPSEEDLQGYTTGSKDTNQSKNTTQNDGTVNNNSSTKKEENNSEGSKEQSSKKLSKDEQKEVAEFLSTDESAYATEFDWLIDKAFNVSNGEWANETDPEFCRRIEGDEAALLNGGWKCFICEGEMGYYTGQYERYMNAVIDTDGKNFKITLNWDQWVTDTGTEQETGKEILKGKWDSSKGTVHTSSSLGNVDFTDFYITYDNGCEYAVGTLLWNSGEVDHIGLMRGTP